MILYFLSLWIKSEIHPTPELSSNNALMHLGFMEQNWNQLSRRDVFLFWHDMDSLDIRRLSATAPNEL